MILTFPVGSRNNVNVDIAIWFVELELIIEAYWLTFIILNEQTQTLLFLLILLPILTHYSILLSLHWRNRLIAVAEREHLT